MPLHDTSSLAEKTEVSPPIQLELNRILAEADAMPLPERPPATKRGAQTTNAGLHWLGLSHSDPSGRVFCDLLEIPEAEWREGDHGMAHYPRCRFCGSIRVGYGDDPHNGSHMEVSGKACEEIESMPWFTTWGAFFSKALAMGFKPSRCDAYKDVYDGSITVEELQRKWRGGEVSSRAEDAVPFEKLPKGCGEDNAGITLAIGSRKSGTYLRVYNKAKEQAPKGEGREGYLREVGPWVRIEVELKEDRALLFMREVAERGWGPQTVGMVINGHTEFKDMEASGKNRYRAKVWEPWRKAMATSEKVRRSVVKALPTIVQLEQNLERQWGPTIAALQAHYGGDPSWVKRMAARNFERIGNRLVGVLEGAEKQNVGWEEAMI